MGWKRFKTYTQWRMILMETQKTSTIQKFFEEMPDPRSDFRVHHSMISIVTITLCAMICGANNFDDIALFGEAKKEWLSTFLDLPYGVPSHDTINRFFSILSPTDFSKCFLAWTQALAEKVSGVIAIDGKTLRHSFDSLSGQTAIHMVSAWCHDNELVLGQIKTDAKSNEITAIPKLLDLLDIKGSTITIDAMGCQKNIVQKILDRGANYILTLKGNQENTLDFVEGLFTFGLQNNFQGLRYTEYETLEKDHGRIEERHIYSIQIGDEVEFQGLRVWAGLKSVTMIISRREITGQEATEECRYYLSSLEANAEAIASAIRSHWGIENRLHWVLDMHFGEDQARNRKQHSAENMAMVRHLALNLLRKCQMFKKKMSIRGKRLLAGWNNQLMLESVIWA
jgi:predicted transposase YbfD/YdcC